MDYYLGYLLVTAGTVIPLGLAFLITAYIVRRKQRKERENAEGGVIADAV